QWHVLLRAAAADLVGHGRRVAVGDHAALAGAGGAQRQRPARLVHPGVGRTGRVIERVLVERAVSGEEGRNVAGIDRVRAAVLDVVVLGGELERVHVRLRGAFVGAVTHADVVRDRNGCEDADDHHHDHQLHQRESSLPAHGSPGSHRIAAAGASLALRGGLQLGRGAATAEAGRPPRPGNDYWPLDSCSRSLAALPSPPMMYVCVRESEYATMPDVAGTANVVPRWNAATSAHATPVPCVPVNGFLKFAPACGSSGSTSTALSAYTPSFCTP